MAGKVVVVGTFDTKGEEFAYLISCIRNAGADVISVNTGVLGEPSFKADISSKEVAQVAGFELEDVKKMDRGACIDTMMQGAAKVVLSLYEKGMLDGIISMGGSAGTMIGTNAMKALPIGIPKLQVSTLASGDTKAYVGAKDIIMMPSILDISGLNRISRMIIGNAAHAIAGMAMHAAAASEKDDKPLIAATMFGVTTPCVTIAREYLESKGYEVLVFHAVGTGGQAMEALIEGGFIQGVLDVTTTEWADELVGGVLGAGPARLEAAGKRGIPQVVSTGALDMVNFWQYDTVPEKFKDRNLYKHNANVTLMRTTPAENNKLGEIISAKLNAAQGPCALFLPLQGVSAIDMPGKPFFGEEEDRALFDSLRKHIDKKVVDIIEMDHNVNDEAFALAMARKLENMLTDK
jgi:uncharacterized protein (UPF0261 family)